VLRSLTFQSLNGLKWFKLLWREHKLNEKEVEKVLRLLSTDLEPKLRTCRNAIDDLIESILAATTEAPPEVVVEEKPEPKPQKNEKVEEAEKGG